MQLLRPLLLLLLRLLLALLPLLGLGLGVELEADGLAATAASLGELFAEARPEPLLRGHVDPALLEQDLRQPLHGDEAALDHDLAELAARFLLLLERLLEIGRRDPGLLDEELAEGLPGRGIRRGTHRPFIVRNAPKLEAF